MADFEITFACHLLRFFGGREIVFAAFRKEEIKGLSGMIYKPTALVSDISSLAGYEALLLPGGWQGECPDELLELIRRMDQEKKLLCAICSGPWYLAKAGVLKDRPFATSLTPVSLKTLGQEEDPFSWEHAQEDGVVRAGSIITAKANAFIDFGVAVYDALGLFENEEDKIACADHFKGR